MNSIRYAMVGFGGIAENRLAREGFGLAGGSGPQQAELVGATDLNPERRPAAEALGLRWYQDLGAILDDPAVNALVVATGNSSHADIALTAMEAGKHCLVEKPMATSLQQAEAMVSAARRGGMSLSVDHMMEKNVYNIQSRKIIESGQLGRINDFCLHMEFLHGAVPEEASGWRCACPDELGGPIGDVGSHCLYMAEFLFASRVAGITACLLPRRLVIAVEDGAVLRLRLENGLQGTIRVSFAEARGGPVGTLSNLGYEIYGEQAVLRGYGTLFQLSGFPGEPIQLRLECQTEGGVSAIDPGPPVNIYTAVIEEHARSIVNRRPFDGRAGRHNLELILAAYKAARQGVEVLLS